LTDKAPVFLAGADGLSVKATQSELEAMVFTVTVKFDTDNMWWGNSGGYEYGANTAPNSLDGLTMGFTGYIGEFDDQGDLINNYVDDYTGNMMAVPEPASFLLFGSIGVSLVDLMRRRRQ
ncbi:MAG TPA: PEP-CTERM sorting domain-containing protein, partial [Sedimentisphaerales bacterium]|nr:PEP-CTERM sorting domain-containing protein [Sedimentisphaerales bacterium]